MCPEGLNLDLVLMMIDTIAISGKINDNLSWFIVEMIPATVFRFKCCSFSMIVFL